MALPQHAEANMKQERYRIDFEERDGYLRAAVTGPSDSVEISLAYWRDVAAECRRLGYSRLLLVEDLGPAGPILEYYLVACALPEILRDIRVAMVDAVAEELAPNRFGEHVALSRGATTRLFRNEDDAIAWLEE